jgi:serine/threonine protein phosphatase PrpC
MISTPIKLIPRKSKKSVRIIQTAMIQPTIVDEVCPQEPINRELSPNEFNAIDTYGGYQIQQRAHEDRYMMTTWRSFRYCAIFDGHGGPNNNGNHVVDYCTQHLHKMLFRNIQLIDMNNESKVRDAIIQTFIQFDTEMFLLDKKYGTTCTIVLIDDTRNKIYQINAGDSRSIIFDANRIISITTDHTPEFDRNRIFSNGGKIINGRINGSLMISRGFGDFSMKMVSNRFDPINGLVSIVPTITIIPKPVHAYALLTSDAPFENDVFINEDLVYMTQIILTETPKAIAHRLVNIVAPKTTDDTTIIIVKI